MSSDDVAAVCLGRIETMIRLDEGERRNLDVAELQAWSLALVAVRLDELARQKKGLRVVQFDGNAI